MSDLNKIFQKVIEIDERKNNSLSNVTKSLMDLEIGEMARQAAERDMFPERDDLTPVNMSNENFAEKTFDNDVNAGLKLLASGYTPEEAFYDLERINDGWRTLGGDRVANAVYAVLSDTDTMAAARNNAEYRGGWDECTGKPLFVYPQSEM